MLPRGAAFARDAEFGWICARLEDCGSAISVGATLHLPSLVMTGLHERFFKSIMDRGAIVRGLYSSEGDPSAGSVFEIVVASEGERIESPPGPQPNRRTQSELLEAFVGAAVRAERRARESLASGDTEAVRDAAGRAFRNSALCAETGSGRRITVPFSLEARRTHRYSSRSRSGGYEPTFRGVGIRFSRERCRSRVDR